MVKPMVLSDIRDRWRDQAICFDGPFEFWEMPDEWTRETEVFDKENLALGMAMCQNCPVKEPCLSTATSDDLLHTVRGGQWPRAVSKRTVGKPPKERMSGVGHCGYGHDLSQAGVTVEERCYECYKVRKRRYADAQLLRRQGIDPTTVLEPPVKRLWQLLDWCPQGHRLPPVEARTGPFCPVCKKAHKDELNRANQMNRTARRRAEREALALAAAQV